MLGAVQQFIEAGERVHEPHENLQSAAEGRPELRPKVELEVERRVPRRATAVAAGHAVHLVQQALTRGPGRHVEQALHAVGQRGVGSRDRAEHERAVVARAVTVDVAAHAGRVRLARLHAQDAGDVEPRPGEPRHRPIYAMAPLEVAGGRANDVRVAAGAHRPEAALGIAARERGLVGGAGEGVREAPDQLPERVAAEVGGDLRGVGRERRGDLKDVAVLGMHA